MPDGTNLATPLSGPGRRSADPEPTAGLPFAALSAAGHQEWWRFVFALLMLVGFYALFLVGFAGLGLIVGYLMPGGSEILRSPGALFGRVTDWSTVGFADAAVAFALLTLPIIIFLPAVLLAVSWMHQRSPKTVMTARARFDWGAVARSFMAILVLEVIAQVAGYLISPEHYRLVFDPIRFVLFVPLILLLVPLQVMAEEVFFRGYLLQTVGRITQNRAVVVAVPALIFAALHLWNPEVMYGGGWAVATYVTVATYLTWLVVRGDGLEYAFGLHLGINVFVFSMVGSPASPYPSPTIFYVDKIDYALGFPILIAIFAAHYWFLFGRRRASSH